MHQNEKSPILGMAEYMFGLEIVSKSKPRKVMLTIFFGLRCNKLSQEYTKNWLLLSDQ